MTKSADGLYDFSGRRVLVTGAGSGIGRETARYLLRSEAIVIATDLDRGGLDELAAPKNERLSIHVGDLTKPEFVKELVGHAGQADALINCAGWVKHAPFLESDPADWERVYAVNVIALLNVTQGMVRQMAQRKRGHIINVSSILARRVYPYTAAYAGSKHAVRAISDGLRVELQGMGIKVTEIAPGLTETNIFRDIDHSSVRAVYEKFSFPKLQPAEIARAIGFALAAPPESCPEMISVFPMGQA